MIIGNGMIASAFKSVSDLDDVIIFASGVSDSTLNDGNEFNREMDLLEHVIENSKDKLLVYFSAYSILDLSLFESPYVIHKLKMEKFIKERCGAYLIFRASNVVGKAKNNKTIFNFIKNRVLKGESVEIWKNACRNFIDLEDVRKMVVSCIKSGEKNNTLVVANPKSVKIIDFVLLLEKHYNKNIEKIIIDKGGCLQSDQEPIEKLATKSLVIFDFDYLTRLIEKYAEK